MIRDAPAACLESHSPHMLSALSTSSYVGKHCGKICGSSIRGSQPARAKARQRPRNEMGNMRPDMVCRSFNREEKTDETAICKPICNVDASTGDDGGSCSRDGQQRRRERR